MTKDEALQMCLEYIETDAHERRHVRWAIKEALAQPEQDPVAHWSDCAVHSEPAYPKGECDCGGIVAVADYTALSDKYVALKAQRTWVGLTDEEIQECYSEAYKIVQGRQLEIAFYKTIEAKLKENNNG
jgi:hypothetical protein